MEPQAATELNLSFFWQSGFANKGALDNLKRLCGCCTSGAGLRSDHVNDSVYCTCYYYFAALVIHCSLDSVHPNHGLSVVIWCAFSYSFLLEMPMTPPHPPQNRRVDLMLDMVDSGFCRQARVDSVFQSIKVQVQ